jgi:hypothetical protein
MRSLFLALVIGLLLAAPAEAVPQWLAPVQVADGGQTNIEGNIAVAPNGTTLAVSDLIGGEERVRARLRRPGEAFGQIFDLSPAGVVASNPSVAVDQQGNFTVAWLEAPNSQVHAARLPAGAGAFADFQTVSTGNPTSTPVVGVGGNGTAVIAYFQDNVIKAAIRPSAPGQFLPATAISGVTSEPPEVAVDDGGNAIIAWSRDTGDRDLVEVSERPAGGGFPPPAMARILSTNVATHRSTGPALAMVPDGRALVLWTHRIGAGSPEVQYSERTGTTWSSPQLASKPTEAARLPDVAVAANGAAVASWIADVGSVDVVQGAVRAPGQAFGDYRNFPSTTVGVPEVEGNRAGDAFVAWNGFMGEAILGVRRPAGGDFGSVDTVALGTQGAAMPAISLFLQNFAVDDQGNATALWQLSTNPGGTFVFRLEAASFDAVAPTLNVSVPGTGNPGAAIGMAAAASDRLSAPAIAWSFGDGSAATGPAVSHAYAAPGAYSVMVTATDAAGNSTSLSTSVAITEVAGPPPTPRINSPVSVLWAKNRTRVFLLRMKVRRVPQGGKAELRCRGKKCPFKRKSSTRRRKGAITLYKAIKPSRVVGIKNRTFRPGQRLQLRITAPGHIGKVVKYRIRRGSFPVGVPFCLPLGSTKPQKRCSG